MVDFTSSMVLISLSSCAGTLDFVGCKAQPPIRSDKNILPMIVVFTGRHCFMVIGDKF